MSSIKAFIKPKLAPTPDMIPDGYVLVPSSTKNSVSVTQSMEDDKSGSADSKDVKVAVPQLKLPVQLRTSRTSAFAKPVDVKLVARFDLVGSAGLPLDQVQALSPIGVADWSEFASLYDTCQCRRVDIQFCLIANGVINGFVTWGVAWDPANVGAYASVAQVITAQHHVAPLTIGGNTGAVSPQLITTKGGFFRMTAKPPQTRVTSDTVTDVVGGGIFSTSSTKQIVGFFKPYVDSLGPSLVPTITAYATYYCTFKNRT